jgi:hypothetical protein
METSREWDRPLRTIKVKVKVKVKAKQAGVGISAGLFPSAPWPMGLCVRSSRWEEGKG